MLWAHTCIDVHELNRKIARSNCDNARVANDYAEPVYIMCTHHQSTAHHQ